MTTASLTEQLGEDVASVYFGTLAISIRRGVEIDDAGEARDGAVHPAGPPCGCPTPPQSYPSA